VKIRPIRSIRVPFPHHGKFIWKTRQTFTFA